MLSWTVVLKWIKTLYSPLIMVFLQLVWICFLSPENSLSYCYSMCYRHCLNKALEINSSCHSSNPHLKTFNGVLKSSTFAPAGVRGVVASWLPWFGFRVCVISLPPSLPVPACLAWAWACVSDLQLMTCVVVNNGGPKTSSHSCSWSEIEHELNKTNKDHE